ncbi:MAG: DUF4476 domain-containing protein [Spirochaetaceae bacterium]|nr:MAG: DUF4476 domain-containing protein [Spirochaetaceae bacterium]
MKKNYLLFAVITALIISASAAAITWAQDGRGPERHGPAAWNPVEKIRENLKFIEDSYIKLFNFSERREAIKRVDEINTLLKDADIHARPAVLAIPDNEFGQMMQAMNRTQFYKNKKAIFTAYSRKYQFTANQIRTIMGTLPFMNDKADFIKYSSAFVSTKEELVSLVQQTESQVIEQSF